MKEEPGAAAALAPTERPERSCLCVDSGDAVVDECLLSSEVPPPSPQDSYRTRRKDEARGGGRVPPPPPNNPDPNP